jgi:phenylalanyl-tRNA synthetase beta chain
LDTVRLVAPGDGPTAGARPVPPGLHPTRSAWLVVAGSGPVVGAVGEVDPDVAAGFGVLAGRIGWLEADLGMLLDPSVVPRRSDLARPVSRFPSSDIDLAFSVPDEIPADRIADTLRQAAGDLLESVELFDVFRSSTVGPDARSLAFRLRFCALDRTLTDAEVGPLRQACIEAATEAGAVLR